MTVTNFELTDEMKTRAAATQLVAMACDRYPPDIIAWALWLDTFIESNLDPQITMAAIRAYAKLHWQLEAHCSVYGPH